MAPAGVIAERDARLLASAGALVTAYLDLGVTLIHWPEHSLRRFMLFDVLLHEIGHHVLQHNKGKRLVRIARTRDHEAYATRFAAKWRGRLVDLIRTL